MHKLCTIALATLTALTFTLAAPISTEALEHTIHITSEIAEEGRADQRLFGRKLGEE